MSRYIKKTRDEMLAQRDGPFRPPPDDPIVRPLLLPLGGTGATITTAKLLRAGG